MGMCRTEGEGRPLPLRHRPLLRRRGRDLPWSGCIAWRERRSAGWSLHRSRGMRSTSRSHSIPGTCNGGHESFPVMSGRGIESRCVSGVISTGVSRPTRRGIGFLGGCIPPILRLCPFGCIWKPKNTHLKTRVAANALVARHDSSSPSWRTW